MGKKSEFCVEQHRHDFTGIDLDVNWENVLGIQHCTLGILCNFKWNWQGVSSLNTHSKSMFCESGCLKCPNI